MSSGDRRNQRRLFSFDTNKPSESRRSSSESSRPETSHSDQSTPSRGHTKFATQLDQVPEQYGIPNNESGFSPWTGDAGRTITRSPGPSRSRPLPEAAPRTLSPVTTNFTAHPVVLEAPPSSPSVSRWESLRQHVVPGSSSHTQQASASSSSSSAHAPPPRSTTPKPSRLARLGLRQVVEQVAIDQVILFTSELQKACLAARGVEGSGGKGLNVGFSSTTNLPFMSSTSLAPSAAPSKVQGLRRPASVLSLGTASRPQPTLKPLHAILRQRCQPRIEGLPEPAVPFLPVEAQVLSTLLTPFLSAETSPHIDEERWLGIESFDLIVKGWNPKDEESGIQRCVWLTKAAMIPPSQLRTRIIGTVWALIVPAESSYSATSPESFCSLIQSLFMLLPSVHSQSQTNRSNSKPTADDFKTLTGIIRQVRGGCGGELDQLAIEERYNALYVGSDDPQSVRDVVMTESLARCMEFSPESTRSWLLAQGVEMYWPIPPPNLTLTPLLNAIHTRKLSTFCRSFLSVMSKEKVADSLTAQLVAGFLDTRVIPEAEALNGPIQEMNVARGVIVKIAMQFLCTSEAGELTHWAASLLSHWYREEPAWKKCCEATLKAMLTDSPWPILLNLVASLLQGLPDDIKLPIISFVLPLLNDRLVEDPPEHPNASLTGLFDVLSHMYPQVYYKPVFACAASSKEFTVINFISVLAAIARFQKDFWFRSAEMISVALMSDGAGQVKGKGKEKAVDELDLGWGVERFGQNVLLVELAGKLQTIRRLKEDSKCSEAAYIQAVKFALTLESRLAVLLPAREKTSLVPPAQRMLFALLFREIRLLTRSLKPAGWLPQLVTWFMNYHSEHALFTPFDDDVARSVTDIQRMYAVVKDSRSTKRRSTMLLSPSLGSESTTPEDELYARNELVQALSKGFAHRMLKLFVTVSVLLSMDQHRRIGPVLWEEYLDSADPSLLVSVAFLVMQAGEKAPDALLTSISVDLQSTSDHNKLSAIRRLTLLSMCRTQIMLQNILTDRSHRPFKVTRGPLPFVTTDIGTSHFTREETIQEQKDKLPLELRKRLADIGWGDEEVKVDPVMEWIHTPMSLLPSQHVERQDVDVLSSETASPQKRDREDGPGLLRRNSSSGGPAFGVKRRMIFVPALAQLFLRLAELTFDPSFTVSSAARHLIVDLMRNDPTLLTRPSFDLLAGSHKHTPTAVTSLRNLLSVQNSLPPSLAYHVFNHITGFLKFIAKQDGPSALYDYAQTIPLLVRLVTEVGDMSIRELRRAKIEAFLVPSGSLWFSDTAPMGTMFPRELPRSTDPFEHVPPELISITMIRVAQNLLLVKLLKKNQNEIQLIRKMLKPLVLPSLDPEVKPLQLQDFVPIMDRVSHNRPEAIVRFLSIMVARSYIPLVAQLFRCMSRHLNDKTELNVLVEGLIRILLRHGHDIGIVGHCLIALMIASTRFRRLFGSGGGYTFFMPALIKIYAECEDDPGIRHAIEYAVNRFYAHHQQAFVFQTLDVMSHIIMLPNIDHDRLAQSVYTLFASLRRGVATSPDAAGIHNANKEEESAALLVSTADDKSGAFLAALGKAGTKGKDELIASLPQEYDSVRLGTDDFVRLFLTIIAHDVNIARAEYFLKFLRFLAPFLYNASSSARMILEEGTEALGQLVCRLSPKGSTNRSDGDTVDDLLFTLNENRLLEKSRGPSNFLSMQLDYLSMVVAISRSGGQVSPATGQRIIELVKAMLREMPHDANNTVSSFLSEFIKTAEKWQNVKAVGFFLVDLGPIIESYSMTIDFSGVFAHVESLTRVPAYANDASFARALVKEICAKALLAAEMAASNRMLANLPARNELVSLLASTIFVQGVDIMHEVEKRAPSYDFLAHIVFPLALKLRTVKQLDANGQPAESWQRRALVQAWTRVLNYAMVAGQNINKDVVPARSKSRGRSRSRTRSGPSQVPALMTTLQIIKVIVARAPSEIAISVPDIWSRLGAFLRTFLESGTFAFAFKSGHLSPSASPSQTPRASAQFDNFLQPSMSFEMPSPSAGSFRSFREFPSPRFIDYCAWSFYELVCMYRTPLFLQLRPMIQERTVLLDTQLRHHQSSNPFFSPVRIRPASSIFSKPRRRSGMPLPSPDASPRLSPAMHTSMSLAPRGYDVSLNTLDIPQSSSWRLDQSVSPSEELRPGPKIVHLGPSSAQLGVDREAGVGGLLERSKTVKSMTLVRNTYRRIRTVQYCMGYQTLLLPMPDGIEEEVVPQTWSIREVLGNLVKEMKFLMEEFEEIDSGHPGDLSGEPVVVEMDQSLQL